MPASNAIWKEWEWGKTAEVLMRCPLALRDGKSRPPADGSEGLPRGAIAHGLKVRIERGRGGETERVFRFLSASD